MNHQGALQDAGSVLSQLGEGFLNLVDKRLRKLFASRGGFLSRSRRRRLGLFVPGLVVFGLVGLVLASSWWRRWRLVTGWWGWPLTGWWRRMLPRWRWGWRSLSWRWRRVLALWRWRSLSRRWRWRTLAWRRGWRVFTSRWGWVVTLWWWGSFTLRRGRVFTLWCKVLWSWRRKSSVRTVALKVSHAHVMRLMVRTVGQGSVVLVETAQGEHGESGQHGSGSNQSLVQLVSSWRTVVEALQVKVGWWRWRGEVSKPMRWWWWGAKLVEVARVRAMGVAPTTRVVILLRGRTQGTLVHRVVRGFGLSSTSLVLRQVFGLS